jgi:hypothetical protein
MDRLLATRNRRFRGSVVEQHQGGVEVTPQAAFAPLLLDGERRARKGSSPRRASILNEAPSNLGDISSKEEGRRYCS